MTSWWWQSSRDVVEALALTLAHFLWQGLALAALLALAIWLGRGLTAQRRYTLSFATLAAMAAAPVVTFLVLTRGATSAGPGSTGGARFTALAADPTTAETTHTFATGAGVDWTPWIAGLWCVGVLALGVRHLDAWRRTRRVRATALDPVDPDLQRQADAIAARLGIPRRVPIRITTALDVPAVVGWLSPVVLVPLGALTGMSAVQVQGVLAHELAHVRRGDYFANLLQIAVETLLFFHPAVWWVSAQIRMAREMCCDDLAVACSGDRRAYALALTQLEAQRAALPAIAVGADGSSLATRVRRLAGAPAPRTRNGSAWFGTVVAVTVLVAAGLLLDSNARAVGPQDDGEDTASAPRSGDVIEGAWRAEFGTDEVDLQMREDKWGRRSNYGGTVDRADLTGLELVDGDRFELRREAGVFEFVATSFDVGRRWSTGHGDYAFRPNPDYVDRMVELRIRGLDEHDLYLLALLDVEVADVEAFHAAGLDRLNRKRLMAFAVHRVTPEFVQAMADAGYDDLDEERLVEFRIHGITPDYIEEMVALGYGVREERLVEFKIHGITPDYVQALADLGYADLPGARLVEFKIHGVTPRWIERLQERGYDDLSPRELVDRRIHGRHD